MLNNLNDFVSIMPHRHLKNFLVNTNSDGVIPYYSGFHPHTLWSSYYVYMQEENGVL
jgi:hypothetical protein